MSAWPGWSNENTLVLPVDEPPPDSALDVGGRRFDPRKSLHITLVGRALGAELRQSLGERLEIATRPAFEALDWTHERSGRRLVIEREDTTDDGSRGTVASVVELVELPALAYYYRWLGELLGRELPVPPPHITLYTHGKAKGIGIPTRQSLRAWGRPFPPAM